MCLNVILQPFCNVFVKCTPATLKEPCVKEKITEMAQWERSGFVNGMVAPYILCHSGTINRHYLSGAAIMNVKTIGIDLAKEVLQDHGIDEHGKRLFNKQLKRAKMLSFLPTSLPV
ncbi:Uncharacterised protein [Serratia fonticola]|nr:Uncharacterised protein [Serratia fonticola]